VNTQNQNYSSVDGVLFDKNITSLIKYPQAKQETNYTIPSSVTAIGREAFYKCRYLTSVIIPSNVRIIWGYAFVECRRLTSIIMSRKTTTAMPLPVQIITYSD
jgi:hypothetical protein